MSMNRRTLSKTLAGMALGGVAPFAAAQAQDYPNKPIRLIVGYPPGGANDTMARFMATRLGEALGQSVIVDNRAGANGVIGSDLVAKAEPDGYTLLSAGLTPGVLNRLTYKKLPYNPATDLVSITSVATSPILFVVRPNLGVNTMQELAHMAKTRPGTLNFATVGSGGSTRIILELFNQSAGVEIKYVPYKGGAPAMTDLLAGTVDGMALDLPALYPFVKDGKLKPIGITSEARSPLLPNVATVAQQGMPDLSCGNWFGLLGPGKLPRPIVLKLHAAIARTVNTPEIRQQLLAQGFDSQVSASPEAFAAFTQAELARWGKVIKTAQIEAE